MFASKTVYKYTGEVDIFTNKLNKLLRMGKTVI